VGEAGLTDEEIRERVRVVLMRSPHAARSDERSVDTVDGIACCTRARGFATRKARSLPLQQRREDVGEILRQTRTNSRRRVTVVF